MTTRFRRTATCGKCGNRVPIEDDFSQWIRGCPQLDSADGFAFMDKDLVVHRFKTTHGRTFQCLMAVEIKTRFDLDPDTLEDMDWRIHHAPKSMELFPTS